MSWQPGSGDVNFRVLVNGNVVATTATPAFRFHGLGCNAAFTVGVAAVNAVGNVSPTVETPARTASCSATALTMLGRDAARGASFRKAIRVLREHYSRRSARN